jgi:hypothetical protein
VLLLVVILRPPEAWLAWVRAASSVAGEPTGICRGLPALLGAYFQQITSSPAGQKGPRPPTGPRTSRHGDSPPDKANHDLRVPLDHSLRMRRIVRFESTLKHQPLSIGAKFL